MASTRHVTVAPTFRSPIFCVGSTRGKIVEIDAIVDPERLRRFDLAFLD